MYADSVACAVLRGCQAGLSPAPGRESHEAWGTTNRKGRSISVQRITIVIRDRSYQVFENDVLQYESKGAELSFDSAHVYLQMSSHSNYRAREVYFDNLRIR